MKISETFASKYLKAADLNGRTHRVTIASVYSQEMEQGKIKPVAYFQGAAKGLVLNRTNSTTIAYALGDDTENWVGQQIEIFPQMVSFQGRMEPAIRVRVPEASATQNGGEIFAQTPPARPDRIAPNAANRPTQAVFDERNPPPIGGAPARQAVTDELDDPIPF